MISIYVEFANGDRKTFRGIVEKEKESEIIA